MAYNLIRKLKEEKVECIVAPYEADAQLAFLARSGYVSCVITEDSDLIPYGAPRVGMFVISILMLVDYF